MHGASEHSVPPTSDWRLRGFYARRLRQCNTQGRIFGLSAMESRFGLKGSENLLLERL